MSEFYSGMQGPAAIDKLNNLWTLTSGVSTNATNAANSAAAAASSATAAASSYDAFDDRYLGQKASAPTLDNDGNALLTGALYFNTTDSTMYVRTSSATWVSVSNTASSTAAAGSATAAAGSASAAATSATNASNSATAAAGSATTASTQATNASNSATTAAGSATTASTQATNAANSATAAAGQATTASTQATNAANSATAAATSATNAANSYDAFDDRYLGQKASAPTLDNDGAALLTGALYFNTTDNTMYVRTSSATWVSVSNTASSTAAATSATNAASSATAAASSATSASGQATTATTKASEASTSATNAANSATAAATSATNASNSATAAAGSATTASTQATNASNSATAAAGSATTASTQATNAANSATAAATSATNAANSYDAFDDRYLGQKAQAPTLDNDNNTLLVGALYFNTTDNTMYVRTSSATWVSVSNTTSSTAAATSATNAANSATAAATSATDAANSYDAFDDRYLGQKASAPTLDNDGAALLTGALYFNTTDNTMYVRTSSATWVSVSNTASSTAAATSATNASNSATAAATSATNASNSATAAAGSATTASTQATNAANSATDAAGSATTASTQATNAANSATAAAGSATTASTQATNAANSATAAAGSATTATTKASEASTSATNAAGSATTATTQASNASASATLAQNWASQLVTPVQGGEYSAKYWAQQAAASVTGQLVYRGQWSAATGSYPVPPSVGSYYKVSVAGTVSSIDYAVNDQIIYNGTDWDKIDSTEQVSSVAGKTGVVTLVKGDVGLGNVANIDTTNATNITGGTLADARLSSNIARLNTAQTWTASQNFGSTGFEAYSATNDGTLSTVKVGRDAGQYISFHGQSSANFITSKATDANPKPLIIQVRTDTTGFGFTFGLTGGLVIPATTGTAPLGISSTTLVTNLNADMVDGAQVGTAGATIPLLSTNNTWSGTQRFADGVRAVFGTAGDYLSISAQTGSVEFDQNKPTFFDFTSTNYFAIRNQDDTFATAFRVDLTTGANKVQIPRLYDTGITADRIKINQYGTGNRYALVDLIGDATYTDYGLRIIRDNTGANTGSGIYHRGTGALQLHAQDAGYVSLGTNNLSRFTIASNGNAVLLNDVTYGAQWQGLSIRQMKQQGSVVGQSFIDFENELSIPKNSLHSFINADGSSALRFQATAAGVARGVDTRNTVIEFGTTGVTSYYQNAAPSFISSDQNGFRLRTVAGSSSGYGTILRNDGNAFYLLHTANNDSTGTFTTARPFAFNFASKTVTILGDQDQSGTRTIYLGVSGASGSTTNLVFNNQTSAGVAAFYSADSSVIALYPKGIAGNYWLGSSLINSADNPIINVDANDYIFFDRAADKFHLRTLGVQRLIVGTNGIAVANTSTQTGAGISLYSDVTNVGSLPTYGIAFAGTASFGTHAGITDSWSTYFTTNNTPNRGWIFRDVTSAVNVASITNTGNMTLNGHLQATTKSFLIDHPTKEGLKLRYGSLESPYHGIRLTGEGETYDGVAVIELPDYVYALCKQEGATVQLTNIRHGKVLWVEEIDVQNNTFTVATEEVGSYKFYWSFTAIRKDIPDMVVEE